MKNFIKKYTIVLVFLLSSSVFSQGDGCWFSELFKDFDKNPPEFKAFVNSNTDALYAYEQLYKAGRPGLRQNIGALTAYTVAKNNAKLKQLGFTDELLARINGYSASGYDEILTDLNKLGDFLTQKNIRLDNFQSTIGILTGNNANYRQGVHWIIQDIGKESAFANKTLEMELGVANARETFSFIDVVCRNCSSAQKNIHIEYKSGPGSITKETIKKQFIERDLFSVNAIEELQWRMKNTALTPEILTTWLKENKAALNSLPTAKKDILFPNYDRLSGISDADITTFTNTNYNLIFR